MIASKIAFGRLCSNWLKAVRWRIGSLAVDCLLLPRHFCFLFVADEIFTSHTHTLRPHDP
jgi:hypothetical protein